MHEGIPFNNARGKASALQSAPPFVFSDVMMSVFPLQANLSRLKEFCDGYLNQARDIVRFDPFVPYVFLIILDYGRMSVPAANTGWLSQREVAFGVPLRWMERKNGEFVFKDFAFTTPFIFVDNEISLTTGREVYGWPKLLARLDPTVDEWIRDPHGARKVFEIRPPRTAEAQLGPNPPPFLSVSQTPLSGLADFPTRLGGAANAFTALPTAFAGMARFWRDIAAVGVEMLDKRAETAPTFDKMFDREAINRFVQSGARDWLNDPKNITGAMSSAINAMFPKIVSNTINLKQFRAAADPMRTCYQAITNAEMPVTRVGGGGMLGAEHMMLGQLNGGYRVDLANTMTVPVMNSLGLIPSETRQNGAGTVSSFAPICPYWIQLDMLYGLGETVAHRGRVGEWRPGRSPATAASGEGEGDAAKTETKAKSKAAKVKNAAAMDVEERFQTATHLSSEGHAVEEEINSFAQEIRAIQPANPFNTTRGASEALGGVFRFPNAKLRVLPLLADELRLDRFAQDYLSAEGHMTVRAWGRYVYMIVATYETITSDLNPTARFSVREVSFSLPVKCYEWSDRLIDADAPDRAHGGRMLGVAMATPFNYVDDIGAAITESEIFGVPTLRSIISSPPVGWGGASGDRGVLLETKSIAAQMLGGEMEMVPETLIRVRNEPTVGHPNEAEWRRIAAPWLGHLADDLEAKLGERDTARRIHDDDNMSVEPQYGPSGEAFETTRGAAMRIMAGLSGIDNLGLKQFRDVTRPNKACYQGLVIRPTKIERLHSLAEIDQNLTVQITRLPTQPIAEIMGLVKKRTDTDETGVVDEFEPVRPFEMNADLIKERGRTLYERVDDEPWRAVDLPVGLIGWRETTPDKFRKLADESYLSKIAYIWDDPNGRSYRYQPVEVTKDVFEKFEENLKNGRIRDLKLLSESVPIGTLWRHHGPKAMDEGRIGDLALYARSRLAMEDEPSHQLRIHHLTEALERVTPSTVLDTMLSRGWCAPGRNADDLERSDFQIRRMTVGPELGDDLFPQSESQGETWPMSNDAIAELETRMRGAQTQITTELRAFLQFVRCEGEEAGVDEAVRAAQIIDLMLASLPWWFVEQCLKEFMPTTEAMYIMEDGPPEAPAAPGVQPPAPDIGPPEDLPSPPRAPERANTAPQRRDPPAAEAPAAPGRPAEGRVAAAMAAGMVDDALGAMTPWTEEQAQEMRDGVARFFREWLSELEDDITIDTDHATGDEVGMAIAGYGAHELRISEETLNAGERFLRRNWLRLLDRYISYRRVKAEGLREDAIVDTMKRRLSEHAVNSG